jgi:(2Fe-2S) ferredoxin
MSFDYDPTLGLYISVDPGYSNPFACLWIMPVEKGERVMVLDEYYQRFRTTPENARAIVKQHQEMGHPPLRMGYATRPIPSAWCF